MKNGQKNVKSTAARLLTAAMCAILITGLCASVRANTSAAQKPDAIVQNDIAVNPATAVAMKPRVALLLPSNKAALAEAAMAVQTGFLLRCRRIRTAASVFTWSRAVTTTKKI